MNYSILNLGLSSALNTMFTDIFHARGYSYHSVSSISRAFQHLQNNHVDLIISSMELEDGNAAIFMEKMNASDFGRTPVIIVSAHDSLEIRKKMFDLGVIDFIPKNINFEQLLHYIQKLTTQDQVIKELGKMKLAVLDDSASERQIIQQILEIYKIKQISFFSRGHDLLGISESFDIYIIDLILEDISGELVIHHLRQKNPNSIIIAISSIDHYKTISSVLLSGASDYVIKPFDQNIFIARISAHVRAYQLLEELRQANETLNRLVTQDGLTELYNHRHICQRLEEELKKAKRYKKDLSVVMLDIDHFKGVNDSYGHQTGDQIIAGVAAILSQSCRDIDIIGRYGGEEYLLVLPETNEVNAHLLANRIRKNIERFSFTLHNADINALQITVSGGVYAFRNLGEKGSDMIKRADQALYAAKNEGRNRIN